MAHLDDALLRRLIDDPHAAADIDRQHLHSCEACGTRFAAAQQDAQFSAALFSGHDESVHPGPALQRVHAQLSAEGRNPIRRPGIGLGARLRRPITIFGTVAALAGVVSLTPAGTLAQSFLSPFQPQTVQAVTVTSADLQNLRGLARYGTVDVPTRPHSESFTSLAAAASASRLHLLAPAAGTPGVPAGTPKYTVQSAVTASFTFNAARASAAGAPAMPAGLNGSTLRVTVGPGVLAEWTGADRLPPLVVAQLPAPTVTSTGASVAVMEDYLLKLPDVSPQLAAQLRAIKDPTSVLPIPIPVEAAQTHPIDIGGVHGIAVGDNTGLGSGVTWQSGTIYAVAGTISEDTARTIAESLR